MTPLVFLKAFLALPLLSSEWMVLPLFPYSDEVIKQHLCDTVSQQNSLSSFSCTELQAWFTKSITVGASAASQFQIAGTANHSVKDIIIIKAMLSIRKETAKNVQAG